MLNMYQTGTFMSSYFCTNLDIPNIPFWHNTFAMTGNYIKDIRTAQKLSQEELAEKLGTTHATVQRHENGKRKLSWEWIQRYANALGCHTLDITEGPASSLKPLNQSEKELLEAFRGLDDSAKQMFSSTLKAFEETQRSDATAPTEKSKHKKEKQA